jgi:hypothetical protein
MSQTRFIVTGAWRLGSSLAGLTDSPEWLRRAAISAVRHSVQHVLKAAETHNCQFILVAGAVASRENFPVAAAWLRERSARLKRHGIRLVLFGHDEHDLQQLQPLDVVAVPAHTCNWVLNGTLGAGPHFSGVSVPLSFEFERVSLVSGGVDARRIRITQLPHAGTAASLGAQQSSGGSLQVTAVSPQRLSADEHDRGCCQLVTADVSRRSLEVQTIPTEVLEFQRVEESFAAGTTLPQLLRQLAARSLQLSSHSPVQLLDWRIGGQVRLSLWDDGPLRERDLLQVLRKLLNAGHSGAWPYRLRFSDDFRVELCSRSSALIAGLTDRTRLASEPQGEIAELLHQLQRVA